MGVTVFDENFVTNIIKAWALEDRTISGMARWEADRIRDEHGSVTPPALAPRIKKLCLDYSGRVPAPLTKTDVPAADYIEVARAFLAKENPVETGDAPNRESYLAALALAGDPAFISLAQGGDIEAAADRIRAKILDDLPQLPEGLYKSLLINALEGVSYYHLAQELQARN